MRPLLQIRQWLLVLGTASILSACSSQPTLPTFSASGFIADDGVIRLWRLNDPQNEPQVLMVVYSPYQDQNTSVTFFEYRDGQLWQVRSQILHAGEQQIQEQLRFNRNNDAIFMQRETASQKPHYLQMILPAGVLKLIVFLILVPHWLSVISSFIKAIGNKAKLRRVMVKFAKSVLNPMQKIG